MGCLFLQYIRPEVGMSHLARYGHIVTLGHVVEVRDHGQDLVAITWSQSFLEPPVDRGDGNLCPARHPDHRGLTGQPVQRQ
ncbi:hypothetical protein CEB94_33090 [Streptomyces hawaiiensis]|uniref:Uncharacterized protein n=1 Tax=Streptomyces hawaiiensis TaxID=67305 RepID=A0A6G5RMQ9_9ACTN|nr:hypothetical protein CEB94_33090 [Streptomyces hawaiiensis]